MIILRHTFHVKKGRMEEALEHFKWWLKRFSRPGARIYTPIKDASTNVIVFDEEFESRADLKDFMSKLRNDPDFRPALDKSHELADGGREHELWQVVESV